MSADPSGEQDAARKQVMESEQEIQSIKAALRKLGSSENGDAPNSIEICMLKVEGLPKTSKPILSLQLSSPVEEAELSEMYNPSSDRSDAPADAPEGSVVKFDGVETSVATLVISAKDADIPLGSSAPHDLAPLCVLDAMDVKEKYVSELPVAIVADGTEVTASPAEVVQEGMGEDGKPHDGQNEKEDAVVEGIEGVEEIGEISSSISTEKQADTVAAMPLEPVCTITLRITYKPSPKDQREELYELLNKTSQRKAAALENLRNISMAMARSGSSSNSPNPGNTNASSSTALSKQPAVKAGFLNKKKKEPTKWEKLYNRTIGPNSMLMKAYGVTIIAKNYIIFFGAVGFFHFKGQLLSLPPPA